ncbi:hypothetical protein RJT34_31917 [Clitoria ternatea]|uniref:Uncharacterized protein n=1 Tax=Clitoria ternatea TaxID=43366 RepID=A0AAN9I5E5_CLITE
MLAVDDVLIMGITMILWGDTGNGGCGGGGDNGMVVVGTIIVVVVVIGIVVVVEGLVVVVKMTTEAMYECKVVQTMTEFGVTVESRRSPGEYWKMVMKDQEMPEGILQLIQPENNHKTQQEQRVEGDEEPLATNAQLNKQKMVVTQNIDPRLNLSAYGDLEPRPSVTKHND